MNNSSIRDNHKNGIVGDFLSEHIKPNSAASIVSAYFTIYAYKKLQAQLDSIKRLRFLFGELNIIVDADRDRAELKNWFDELWNDTTGLVEDVKEQVLKYLMNNSANYSIMKQIMAKKWASLMLFYKKPLRK